MVTPSANQLPDLSKPTPSTTLALLALLALLTSDYSEARVRIAAAKIVAFGPP